MDSNPAEVTEPTQGGGPGIGAIAAASGLGVLLLFVLQNREEVTIDFLFWDIECPLWLYTIVVAVVGALVWLGLGMMRRHQRREERRD